MNDIINKFLLVGNKFMPEMYLRQPGFTYSACGPFTESKERMKKFKQTGDSRNIYRNELDKACFQHDMAYGDFKDLKRRTAADLLSRTNEKRHIKWHKTCKCNDDAMMTNACVNVNN